MNKNNYSMRTRLLRLKGWLFTGLFLCLLSAVNAQVGSSQFAASAGTYTPITGGTVLFATGATYDDNMSAAITIPSFTFNGVANTSLRISTNGYVSFGTYSTGGSPYTVLSSTTTGSTGIAAAFAADQNSTATSEIRYQDTGTEFVVQFTDTRRFNVTGELLDYQIRLEYATSIVRFVYGTMTLGVSTNYPQIGIKSTGTTWGTLVNSLKLVNMPVGTAYSWLDVTNGNANSSTVLLGTTVPTITCASGTTFTWTPQTTVAPVTAFSAVASITGTGATVAWTAPTGATNYDVEYRAAGTAAWTSFGNVAVTTAALTGLNPLTVYHYRVLSRNATLTSRWSHIPTSAAGAGTDGFVAAGSFSTLCSGAPTVGAPNAATVYTCASTVPSALGYAGVGTGGGITYAWEQSPDGIGSWIAAVGGTGAATATYTPPSFGGTDIYYRLVATCSGSPTNGSAILVTTAISPITATTNIIATTANYTTMTIGWTNGSGVTGRAVYVNTVNSFVDPTNGTLPTGAATLYTSGQQLVYIGSASSVAITGLTGNTTYYVRAYEYSCTASPLFNVATSGTNPAAVSTLQYLQYTTARTTGITFTPVSGSGTTLATTGDDNNSGSIVFPFPFTYAGETVSTFSMCTNGWMSLGTPKVALSTATSFSNALVGVASIRIAPFWDDLFLNTGQALKWEVVGTAPNRVLVCEWTNVEVYQYPGPSLTFQVRLSETTNVITFDYGVMQGFDGTLGAANTVNGKPFTSSIGLTQGGTMSTPAVAGQMMGLQLVNTNAWSHLGFITTSAGFNAQTAIPECNSRYTFTPSGSVYTQDARPGIPAAPVNDDPAGAITLSVPVTPPATYCGNFYTSNFGTQTAGYTDHASTFGDDDVWFKFQANSIATTISVLGSAGYDAVIQLFDGGVTDTGAPLSGTAMAGVNATNMTGAVNSAGLTETFTSANAATVVGNFYYVRVYHAGGGTQATATAAVTAGSVTGYTVTAGGTGYITANGVAPIIYLDGPTGLQGVQATLTITGGVVTAVNTQGAQNGFGLIGAGAITVKIPSPGNGVTGDFAINVYATPTPPANDEATASVALTPGAACVTTAGNTTNATQSAPVACTANTDDDVWYSFVADAPALTVTVVGIASFNPAVEGFSTTNVASYAAFTSLGCTNATGAAGTETLNLTGMTVGNTYYVRVYSSANGSGAQGAFTICVTGAAPACATLTSPANAALVGTSTTLTYSSAAATSYTVYSDAVNPPTTVIYTGPNPSYVYTGYPVSVQQFWRVEASNPYGPATGCTTVRSFTRDACPPVTALAAGSITSTTASLSWTENDVATSWDLEIILNSATATGTATVVGTTSNPYSATGLTAATQYKFYVRPSCGGTWVGPFVFATIPANDDCVNAIALTVNADLACGTTTTGSLTGATASAGPVSSCGTFDDDVWFSFVATAASHQIVLTNVSGATDYSFQVVDGCAATSAIVCSDPNTATATGLTIGNTYFVRVATWTGAAGQVSVFTVCVGAFPPPPTNDECASATSVTVNTGTTCTSTTPGTVTSATASTGPASTCGTFDDDVWFSFVATSVTHTVTITNVASSFFGDYSFQVLSSCGAGTALVCSDPSSSNVTGLTPTQTYYIRVASFSSTGGQTGTFTVCVATPPAPPANDNCAGAITIGPLSDVCTNATVNNTSATASGVSVCSGTADDDMWYSFTVPVAQTTVLYSTTNGTGSGDRMFMLYDACGGTELFCEDNESGAFTGLTAGSTYKLRVFTWSNASATSFTLCLQTPPPAPANDDCASAVSLPVNAYGGCATTAGTTLSATEDAIADPTCDGGTISDVWYSFNTGANTSIDVTTVLGSASGLGLEVFSSCGVVASSTPPCDFFIGGLTSIGGLTASTTYLLRVFTNTDFDGAGSFTICLTAPPAPPVNDAICSATTLTVGSGCVSTIHTVLGATNEGVYGPTSCGGTNEIDVWFKFVAPLAVPSNTSHVIISTELNSGGVTDGAMELYSATGTCPGALTLTSESCDDDTNGLLPVIDIATLNAGQTYYVRFKNYGATFTHNGSFKICVVNAGAAPPAIDNIANAANVPSNNNWYPQCQQYSGDCTLSSNSAESSNGGGGVDNWYRFTANSTTVSIEMFSASMNNFIELVQQTGPGVYASVNYENATGTIGGTERLNYQGLTVGVTYYVAVGAAGAGTGGAYTVCIKQLLASGCNTNTASPLDICSNFKATWTGANSYQYNFSPVSVPGSGGQVTAPGTISLGNTSLNLLPGIAYNVIVNATYNLTNGAGTAENFTVFGANPSCANVQIAAHASVEVRAGQRCTAPATLLRTSYMRTDPFVCGVTNYTFRFTPVTDCAGLTTAGASFTYPSNSRIIQLNFNGATTTPASQVIVPQTYYRVEVRPNFGIGGVNTGVYGTARVIFVGGTVLDNEVMSDMAAEADRNAMEDMMDANIYPNPSNGELVNLNVSNISSDNVFVRITDATGRVVYTNRYTVEGSLNTVVTFAQPLASGLYTVEFVMDNERVTERMMIQK